MIVLPLTADHAQWVREWRNGARETLRSGWTTEEQQEDFAISNFRRNYKYWWFVDEGEWQNRAAGGFVDITQVSAEIALIVDPGYRKQGMGRKCVDWLLAEGFKNQGYREIHGESFYCGNVLFWDKIAAKYSAETCIMPNRKWWNGEWYYALYFSITDTAYHLPAPC